jgi:hypothetical protein
LGLHDIGYVDQHVVPRVERNDLGWIVLKQIGDDAVGSLGIV